MKPRSLFGLAALAMALCHGPMLAADADGIALFESKIRPVLIEKRYQCHAAAKQRGGLRLDSKEAVLKGGDGGPALVPGKPNDSAILNALRHQDLKMPPQGKMSDAVIADFARWIELGAPDPRDGRPVEGKAIDWSKARQFWSFQPPRPPEIPKVRDGLWPKNAIDRFILARLKAEGLRPAPPAGKRDLIRRATFDLIGLPPTPEVVEAFVKDESPEVFAQVVDRLLASPHYGERWGRHWLDVACYAEDQAHLFAVKPNTSAHRYRDWVIAAFNDDMPYDRFGKFQIAADLLLSDDAQRMQHLPALGYFGLGAQYYKDNSEITKALADELDERIDTLSRGMLALTVALCPLPRSQV